MTVAELIEYLKQLPQELVVHSTWNMLGDTEPIKKEMIMVTEEGVFL